MQRQMQFNNFLENKQENVSIIIRFFFKNLTLAFLILLYSFLFIIQLTNAKKASNTSLLYSMFSFYILYIFCTSYCFALFILLHILLLFLFFYHIYALVLCYFYIIFICILLHCPLSGPDLIYISLLIIPCIIYYVTNKETLTLI